MKNPVILHPEQMQNRGTFASAQAKAFSSHVFYSAVDPVFVATNFFRHIIKKSSGLTMTNVETLWSLIKTAFISGLWLCSCLHQL